jgi:hypothetical protein
MLLQRPTVHSQTTTVMGLAVSWPVAVGNAFPEAHIASGLVCHATNAGGLLDSGTLVPQQSSCSGTSVAGGWLASGLLVSAPVRSV